MDSEQLSRVLRLRGFPKSSYAIGERKDEAYCMLSENGRWSVFYSERGESVTLRVFLDESAAANDLLDRLTKDGSAARSRDDAQRSEDPKAGEVKRIRDPGTIHILGEEALATQPLLGRRFPHEVRLVRGSRCRTTTALMNEFSAALQFPLYFGHNWAAFDECMRDVGEWMLGAESLTVVIAEAAQLLIDEPEVDRQRFVKAMKEIVEPSEAERSFPGVHLVQPVRINLTLVDSHANPSDLPALWT